MSRPAHHLFPALTRLRRTSASRRRVPFVQQTAAADCGAACLAMVLAHHGKVVRLDDVRTVVGVTRHGADANSLREAAEWYGLRCRGVQVDEVEALKFLAAGSVLHWKFRHFVVFERVTRDGVVIVDPASGRREVPRDELRTAFTGVALTFRPAEGFEPEGERGQGAVAFVKRVVRRSTSLPRIVTLSVAIQLLALALPILTGLIVDRVVPRGDLHLLAVLAGGLAGVVVFHFLSTLLRAHLLLALRTRLDAEITMDFLDHLVDLPFSFFQQRSAGDLMMRLNSNATVREIVTSGALSGVLDGALVSIYLLLLWIVDWPIAALVLLLGALRVGLFLLTRKRHRELMSSSLQAQAESRSYQVEMLAGIETLKAIGAERRAVEHWSNLFVDELNVLVARGRLSALFDSLMAALTTGSPFVILLFGAWRVLTGDLSLGMMLAVSALATGFLTPLATLVGTALQFQLLGSYLERINDVLEAPREQPSDVVRAPQLRGGIRLEAVSFRHGPTLPFAVRDITVEIEPGRFVAIVGISGAGKTTLAHLLLGLYTPSEGRILYDGVDLASLDRRSVRAQLGIVTQQPYLFGSSIRRNIALSDPEIPLSRVVEAAELAHIHDEILAMPMGYETVLADGGASLSGGQRQRLAIARALVHRPAILLLDEATSSLDAISEERIQAELSRLASTRIVIAHRLSTVRGADDILVMDHGRLVERGRHSELMSRRGLYFELVSAQLEEDETDTREVRLG